MSRGPWLWRQDQQGLQRSDTMNQIRKLPAHGPSYKNPPPMKEVAFWSGICISHLQECLACSTISKRSNRQDDKYTQKQSSHFSGVRKAIREIDMDRTVMQEFTGIMVSLDRKIRQRIACAELQTGFSKTQCLVIYATQCKFTLGEQLKLLQEWTTQEFDPYISMPIVLDQTTKSRQTSLSWRESRKETQLQQYGMQLFNIARLLPQQTHTKTNLSTN